MLKVEAHVHDRRAHLTCSGRLVRGDECDLLKQSVLARDEAGIELDVSRLESVDAAKLGALAALDSQLQQAGLGS